MQLRDEWVNYEVIALQIFNTSDCANALDFHLSRYQVNHSSIYKCGVPVCASMLFYWDKTKTTTPTESQSRIVKV